MAIIVTCAECGNRFDVSNDSAGTTVPCSACEKPVTVPANTGRVALSSAKFMPAAPEVHLTKDEIRKVAKRRASVSAKERKKRKVSYVTFAAGGVSSMIFAGVWLAFVGGGLVMLIFMILLILVGIALIIKGIFDYIDSQSAEAELDEAE